MSYNEKCQLLIIGDASVGKTSIFSRFTTGFFSAHYVATIGIDNYKKDITIDDKIVRVQLWDTAGAEKYYSLTKGFFRNAQGIMVVFDVTNSETYDNVRHWTQSIKTHIGSDIERIPVIIIGNKIDLEEREIVKEDAILYAKELGCLYFETSAKTGENINETILFLVKEVLEINKKYKKKNSVNEEKIFKIKKPKDESGCPC